MGVVISTEFGDVFKSLATNELVKVCPFCGDRVFSKQDQVTHMNQSFRNEPNEGEIYLIWIIMLILGLVLVGFAAYFFG